MIVAKHMAAWKRQRAGQAKTPIALFALLLVAGFLAMGADDSSRREKVTFDAICGACHATSLASEFRAEADWEETVAQMIRVGAKGTDEQFALVMRYLLRNLTKVNVNTATAAELAPVLDVSETIAETVVKYRSGKGAFTGLDDLKKVPGLDAAKLEARKDRLVF